MRLNEFVVTSLDRLSNMLSTNESDVIIISDSDEELEAMDSQQHEIQETPPFSPHVTSIWIRVWIPEQSEMIFVIYFL